MKYYVYDFNEFMEDHRKGLIRKEADDHYYILCDENASVPVDMINVFADIAGQLKFIKTEEEKRTILLTAIVCYLEGKGVDISEILIVSPLSFSKEEIQQAFPEFDSGNHIKNIKSSRQKIQKKKTGDEAKRKRLARDSEQKAKRKTETGQMSLNLDGIMPEPVLPAQDEQVQEDTVKPQRKARKKTGKSFLDILKETGIDYDFEEKEDDIRDAVINAAEVVSFEIQLSIRIGHADSEKLYPALTGYFDELKEAVKKEGGER